MTNKTPKMLIVITIKKKLRNEFCAYGINLQFYSKRKRAPNRAVRFFVCIFFHHKQNAVDAAVAAVIVAVAFMQNWNLMWYYIDRKTRVITFLHYVTWIYFTVKSIKIRFQCVFFCYVHLCCCFTYADDCWENLTMMEINRIKTKASKPSIILFLAATNNGKTKHFFFSLRNLGDSRSDCKSLVVWIIDYPLCFLIFESG